MRLRKKTLTEMLTFSMGEAAWSHSGGMNITSPGPSEASWGCADASEGLFEGLVSKQLIDELELPGGIENSETSDGGYKIRCLLPLI